MAARRRTSNRRVRTTRDRTGTSAARYHTGVHARRAVTCSNAARALMAHDAVFVLAAQLVLAGLTAAVLSVMVQHATRDQRQDLAVIGFVVTLWMTQILTMVANLACRSLWVGP